MRLRKLILVALLLIGLAGGAVLAYRYYWVHRYDSLIASVAPTYGLDPKLVHAVIHEESFFRSDAASGAGARGLMQVTDVVVSEWRQERAWERLPEPVRRRALDLGPGSRELLADPELNLHVGSWYLSKLLARYEDEADPLVVALAAYNAGATHAERWRRARRPSRGTPEARAQAFIDAIDYPETRNYVVDVSRRYRRASS